MMTTRKKISNIVIWQSVQIICFIFFLFLIYLQEMRVVEAIKNENGQQQGIQIFLNNMQFPLLPDFFYFLFAPLTVIALSLLLFKKWRWYFIALCGSMIAALLLADKIYHSFFTSVITTHSFSAIGQIGDVKSAIFQAIKLQDLFFVFMFMLFIPLGIFFGKKIPMGLSENKLNFMAEKTLGILVFILLVGVTQKIFKKSITAIKGIFGNPRLIAWVIVLIIGVTVYGIIYAIVKFLLYRLGLPVLAQYDFVPIIVMTIFIWMGGSLVLAVVRR